MVSDDFDKLLGQPSINASKVKKAKEQEEMVLNIYFCFLIFFLKYLFIFTFKLLHINCINKK